MNQEGGVVEQGVPFGCGGDWGQQRGRVFLVEERVKKTGGRTKEKGLAMLPPLVSNPKSEL